MITNLSWLYLPNMWAIKGIYLNTASLKMLRKCHKLLARNSAQSYIRDLNAVSGMILKWILSKQVVVKNDPFKWIKLMPVVGFL